MTFAPAYTDENYSLDNGKFYSKVMTWVAGSFLSATIGAMVVGPFVPPALMMPLYIVALVALLASGFSRKLMACQVFSQLEYLLFLVSFFILH